MLKLNFLIYWVSLKEFDKNYPQPLRIFDHELDADDAGDDTGVINESVDDSADAEAVSEQGLEPKRERKRRERAAKT